MQVNYWKSFLVIIGGIAIMSSCVSTKKFQELESKRNQSEEEKVKLANENQELKTINNEQSSQIAKYKSQHYALVNDTTEIGKEMRRIADSYKTLNGNYNDLLNKYEDAQSGNSAETGRVLTQLKKTQADLIKREDSLASLEKQYKVKKSALDELSQQLTISQQQLEERNKEYTQLMNELKSKDSMMNSLKNSVADALIGFKNEGLTVTRKAGRVYVSMDEKLLFPSGSFAINPRGKEALVKLAKLLENKQDINIIVEGHTDTIPYKANGNIDDNWDLSAKRATTIVRIFQQNSKINPLRITAAGRGEFLPIESNNTKEGRAKNRRTEIILMPDLDKLYQIVQ
jgi:chemotaxis protein MotB